MSRIEELPDDFDESLDLNEAPTTKNVSLEDVYEKRLDPNNISSKSFEEIMLDMSKTPLFMDSLDVANEDSMSFAYEAVTYLS